MVIVLAPTLTLPPGTLRPIALKITLGVGLIVTPEKLPLFTGWPLMGVKVPV
jgi:hypothetical protein